MNQNSRWPNPLEKIRVILILIGLIPLAAGAESLLTYRGHYKNFFVVFLPPDGSFLQFPSRANGKVLGLVDKQLFSQIQWTPANGLSLELAYDISGRIQDPLLFSNRLFVATLEPAIYRAKDLDYQIYPDQEQKPNSFALFQNLDRAILSISAPLADLYLGRQAIAWGNSRVINPTDVIAPFTFNELDEEQRSGVDAVRVRIPIGAMDEIDAGYIFGSDFKWEKSAVFLRSRFYTTETDISFLALGFRENLLFGLDIARSIGGASFWLENAYVITGGLADTEDHGDKNYLRATVGLDYSLVQGTYAFLEYHYNQAGCEEPKDYIANLGATAYREGAVYLMGKHYLIPGVNHQLTSLVTLSGTSLWNLTDGSLNLSTAIEYNIEENIYLRAGVFAGLGNAFVNGLPDSEFGLYPDTYYTSFRIYF